ncbi:MAG: hypothetical protein LBP76_04825, partial [Treponema sp.]|nr:hypothetical protein [Treponema sp.]
LHIHAKNPDYRGCLCSLQGIKIHFREFLYNFTLKRNKLLGACCTSWIFCIGPVARFMKILRPEERSIEDLSLKIFAYAGEQIPRIQGITLHVL